MSATEPPLADDLLWGCEAIAEINRKPGDVYYLLQRGLLPATKTGDMWVALRSALRAHFSAASPTPVKPAEVTSPVKAATPSKRKHANSRSNRVEAVA